MTWRTNLDRASSDVRAIILAQAEHRLQGQLTFVAAQEQRASAVLGAAVAFAAACAAGVATAAEFRVWPGVWGGGAGVVGFVLTAYFAIQSLRSEAFHPLGWDPADFEDDLRLCATPDQIQCDIIEDLDYRLRYNRSRLDDRGELGDRAAYVFLATPGAIAIFALLASAF